MENRNYQTVIFYFETSNGPGTITAQIPPERTIEEIGKQLLSKLTPMYKSIELTKHEIITLQ